MSYGAGGDLFTYLQRYGPVSTATARLWAAELVLALRHLHSLQIVHRDLKPVFGCSLSRVFVVSSFVWMNQCRKTCSSQAMVICC
jgi:hypothetical protein